MTTDGSPGAPPLYLLLKISRSAKSPAAVIDASMAPTYVERKVVRTDNFQKKRCQHPTKHHPSSVTEYYYNHADPSH